MKFAERLYKLRKTNGLTLEDVADNVGLSTSAIGHYEKGTKLPELSNFVRLADYFGVSADYLLGRELDNSASSYIVSKKTCEKIRELRISNKFSPRDFSKLIGIKLSKLEKIEDGEFPDIELVEVIALCFGLERNEFLEKTDVSDLELEYSKIKRFALDRENLEYIKIVMKAKEKGISPKDIVRVEKI